MVNYTERMGLKGNAYMYRGLMGTRKESDYLLELGMVGRIVLTLRVLMSYIYMEHPFLMFLDHTQRRSTVGRTPLDE